LNYITDARDSGLAKGGRQKSDVRRKSIRELIERDSAAFAADPACIAVKGTIRRGRKAEKVFPILKSNNKQ